MVVNLTSVRLLVFGGGAHLAVVGPSTLTTKLVYFGCWAELLSLVLH